jgi:hypothetical protein
MIEIVVQLVLHLLCLSIGIVIVELRQF